MGLAKWNWQKHIDINFWDGTRIFHQHYFLFWSTKLRVQFSKKVFVMNRKKCQIIGSFNLLQMYFKSYHNVITLHYYDEPLKDVM